MKLIRRFGTEESGQALTEYALLICFILLATIAGAAGYNRSIAGVTSAVSSNLVAANNANQRAPPPPIQIWAASAK